MTATKARWLKHRLIFHEPVGTSRRTMHTRDTWYIVLERDGNKSIGECAMFRGLSCDDTPDYERKLEETCREITQGASVDIAGFSRYPSLRFGLECALGILEAQHQGKDFLASSFTQGRDVIPINGLIWMGSYERMAARLKEKIEQGYQCVKLKIGAIRFEEELELIHRIRQKYNEKEIEIRVDANGAFTPREALGKLERLAAYRLHSIEQPIAAGQAEEMGRLCRVSPIPIALDEELIGVNTTQEKRDLLREIQPRYIVLKPSLTGGISASQEWMVEAKSVGAGYWITSALESNIGLDAIARFSYLCNSGLPQGLGTGGLYINNVPYPFEIKNGMFRMTGKAPSTDTALDTLQKRGKNDG